MIAFVLALSVWVGGMPVYAATPTPSARTGPALSLPALPESASAVASVVTDPPPQTQSTVSSTAAPTNGPVYPPPGGVTFTAGGSATAIGSAGGKTNTYAGMDLTHIASVYWGPASANAIGLALDKAGTDTGIDQAGETLTYVPTSNLAGGIAQWTGTGSITDTDISTGVQSPRTLNLRFTLTVTSMAGVPIALTDATSVGLTNGAVLPVTGDFKTNLLFEVQDSSAWHPAVDWFNALHTVDGTQVVTSFEGAFFYTPAAGATLLTVSGAGSGTVTSTPAGINCPSTCSALYATTDTVTLTATPASGGSFSGWSGDCTGTSTCTVAMTAARSVTATFVTVAPQTLTTTVTGTGTITSTPAGINCPSTCTASFAGGTVVALTPTAGTGFVFTGWSGGCTGTGACSVTMNAATSVTATFAAGVALTISKTGTGAGTVTSSPAGISCGATCTASFPSGTSITLTAAPTSGSTFGGWSGGGCSGTAGCTLALSSATTVSATFTLSTASTSCTPVANTSTTLSGPAYPPPGGVTYTAGGGDTAWGRGTGRTAAFSALVQSQFTNLYWGPFDSCAVGLALDKAGTDTGIDQAGETLTYVPTSNLAGGIAQWTGSSAITDTNITTGVLGPPRTLATRFTLTVTTTAGAPLALTDASTIGLANGAVLHVTTADFKATYLFEVQDGTTWYPAIQHFDDLHTVDGTQIVTSFRDGFFYTAAAATAATHLGIHAVANTVAGAPFGVIVDALDASNAIVPGFTGTVTLSASATGGSNFTTAPTATAVAGTATFTGLALNDAANGYTLTATASTLTSTSNAFNVTASALRISAIANVDAGSLFALTVSALDAQNVVAENFTGTVTLHAAATGGSDFATAPTATAVAGVASFTGLQLTAVAVGYVVTATSDSLSATSNSFNVRDTTPPVLTVPANVVVNTAATATSCTVVVADAALTATATDNVPGLVTIVRTGVPAGNSFGLGVTTITYTATDLAGNTATATQTVTVIDRTPPTLTVPAALSRSTGPGATTNTVVISDADLGTATATDLCGTVTIVRTGVPAGNAFPVGATTLTYTATDAAGNTTIATQLVTVLDTTPPVLTVTTPTATALYILGQSVLAAYTCVDYQSGVATCIGNVPNGTPIDTSVVGLRTFTVTATDRAGNTATVTVAYTVGYAVCPITDLTRPARAGSALPIALRLCDAFGRNVSSATITLVASRIIPVAGGPSLPAAAPGQSNPTNTFRYAAGQGSYYEYVLKTPSDLAAGDYILRSISSTGATVDVRFMVR